MHHAPQTWIYKWGPVGVPGFLWDLWDPSWGTPNLSVNLDSQRYSTSEELQRKLRVIAQLLAWPWETWKAGEMMDSINPEKISEAKYFYDIQYFQW